VLCVNVSVTEPIAPAIERTRQMLFRPFDFQKWITLGFCAFLANLGFGSGGGGGGGNGGFGGPGGGGGNADSPEELIEQGKQWVIDHFEWIVLGVMCFVIFVAIVSTLVMWLSSRGQFLFVAGVARDRAEVREPWREFRELGNSLFWFRVWFSLAIFLVLLAALVTCGLLAWPDIHNERFGVMSAVALALGVTTFLVVVIVGAVIEVFLYHFVVPIMYLRRVTAMQGWHEFNHAIFADYKGTLVLYLLFQIVLGVAIGVISTLAMCLTCCIAALPFVGTVILLPLFVFHRSYTLYFLEQFGPEWQFITPPPAAISETLPHPS